MIYYGRGSEHEVMSDDALRAGLSEALDKLGTRRRVLAVPPDITRFHSRAGRITEMVSDYFGEALCDVLPATGTHFALTEEEKGAMFDRVPRKLFRVHRWKENLETLGRVPAELIHELSEGKLSFDWPAQVDSLLVRGGHDLILSIGYPMDDPLQDSSTFDAASDSLSQAACTSPSSRVSFSSRALTLPRRVVDVSASVAIDQSSPEKALERIEGIAIIQCCRASVSCGGHRGVGCSARHHSAHLWRTE